jgi:plasmid replication initiation protein
MEKKNLVNKANTLITARYSATLEELRVIRTLISLVQPDDEDFKPYVFSIARFIKLLGLTDQSKYMEIPRITENLMKKIIKIREGKRLIQVAWLSSAVHDSGSGTVTITFDPNLKPYLLGLKEFFTTYKLENIITLTSKYSIRIYEIIKSNEYREVFELKLDDLIQILQIPRAYSDYGQIRRRILEPAKKEIISKTDIAFEYRTVRQKKKVTALEITIKKR